MNNISQYQIIKQYNDTHREPFNNELFVRDEKDIIECLQKVILSCQRNHYFTLRVESFKIIDNYEEMMAILARNEEEGLKNKNKKKVNQYEYVNLKDTDMVLMIVTYYIEAKGKSQYLDVYILIPKIVDKYYFRIYGNLYCASLQVVDASTYNNNYSSNAKKQVVTEKTTFQPIRIYRNLALLTTVDGEDLKTVYYTSRMFNKSFCAFKYILARYGLYGTINFTGITCISILDKIPDNKDMHNLYVFEKEGIYISIPKEIFDNDYTTQSLILTLWSSIHKDTKYQDLFTQVYWLKSLGGEFNTFTPEKGYDLLKSLENIYDIITKEDLHLPEDVKKDVYGVLFWLIREFGNLRNKDNLDISTKKVRCAEYIASLYAMKMAQGIYRLSDKRTNVSIESIRKVILIKPTFLIESISRCNLVNYRNLVNDLDALTALKYTYKGISGIGEKGNNSVPKAYRSIHVSHLGRVDVNSSSKSDPGMSGLICPFTKLYNGSFSEFEEPNTWDEQFSSLMDNYKKTVGLKELITFKKNILGEQNLEEDEKFVDSCIDNMQTLINPVRFVENTAQYVVEDSVSI